MTDITKPVFQKTRRLLATCRVRFRMTVTVTFTFSMGVWGLGATLHLIEVNIHAKYKQDRTMHIKVIGQTRLHMTFDL